MNDQYLKLLTSVYNILNADKNQCIIIILIFISAIALFLYRIIKKKNYVNIIGVLLVLALIGYIFHYFLWDVKMLKKIDTDISKYQEGHIYEEAEVFISRIETKRHVNIAIDDDKYWTIYIEEDDYYRQFENKTCEIVYFPESKLIVDMKIVESS